MISHRGKPHQRSTEDRHKFKARNGDTLDPLNADVVDLQKRLNEARETLRAKEAELTPYRESVDSLEMRLMNVQCRLNTWWGEYEGRR